MEKTTYLYINCFFPIFIQKRMVDFRRIVGVLAVLILVAGCTTGFAIAIDDTRIFIDDFGREVVLPATVDKVLPSGPLAFSVLMSFNASYLASSGTDLPPHTDQYLPEIYAMHLPQTGGLLMSSKTVNYEEIMRMHELGVDAYVDVGQAQSGLADMLNEFTETSGLASLFVTQNSLLEIPESYRKIGEILGDTVRGGELYRYTKGWVDSIAEGMKKVESSGKKKSALHITSIDGNTISLLGGFTADGAYGYQGTVVNTLADNVVTAKSNKGAGDPYGMEEVLNILLASDPDVIFINGADNHAYYNAFMTNPAFSGLSAVKSGEVYEIPSNCPYSWMPRPFSGWGISGFIWAANILYPDVFNYDTKEKIQEFYKVMINYTMTDEEYAGLTSVSSQASSPMPIAGIIGGFVAAGIYLSRRKQ